MNCDTGATSPADHRRSSAVAQGCPSCGEALRGVLNCDVVHWLCPECGRCWEVETNWLRRVDPSNCPGCHAQSKTTCFEILEADFWYFAP